MNRVYLDSGPLGLLTRSRAVAQSVPCRRWVYDLQAHNVRVVLPEIIDYELRRELIRLDASSALARLDRWKAMLEYAPLTTPVMLLAANMWARARRQGRPTSGAAALDGDVILAATVIATTRPGEVAVVATENVGHLNQFIDARPWDQIRP